MSTFDIDIRSLEENISGLKSIKDDLYFMKVRLVLQTLSVRLSENDNISKGIRNRLGYEQKRLSNEINNIYSITNCINRIKSKVVSADLRAKSSLELNDFINIVKSLFSGSFVLYPCGELKDRFLYLVGIGANAVNGAVCGSTKSVWKVGYSAAEIPLFVLGSAAAGIAVTGKLGACSASSTAEVDYKKLSASLKGEASASVAGVYAEGNVGNLKYNGSLEAGKVSASGEISGGLYDKNGKLNPNFKIEGKAEAELISGKAGVQFGNDKFGGSAEIKGSVGNVGASGSVSGSIFDKNGKLNPAISMQAEAHAKAVTGKASAKVGNEYISATTTAEGTIGGAEAKASFKVSGDGVEAKAGAEAYVARGEISKEYSIFGVKIKTTVGGKAGAIGVSAGGKVSKTEAEVNIGASLGIGADVGIKVDWSESRIGNAVSTTYNYVSKGVKSFTDGASKFISGAGKSIRKYLHW